MNLRTKNHHNCPCSANPGHSSSLTGSDYYCASGSVDYPSSASTYYFNETLWDRAGCTGGSY